MLIFYGLCASTCLVLASLFILFATLMYVICVFVCYLCAVLQAKKAVDSAPTVLKSGIAKAEAEGIADTLKALGGVVELE